MVLSYMGGLLALELLNEGLEISPETFLISFIKDKISIQIFVWRADVRGNGTEREDILKILIFV